MPRAYLLKPAIKRGIPAAEQGNEMVVRPESTFGVRSTAAGARRVFPFYVVCDVSRSMWDPEFNEDRQLTPLSVIEDALPDMLTVLEEDPVAADTAYLSVIAFGDKPEAVLKLTSLQEDPAIPALPRQGSTDYAQVFEFLDELLRDDQQRLTNANLGTYTPVVFFLSDGNPQVNGHAQPEEKWLPARERLEAPAHPFHPVIVALGIGDVSEDTVRKLRSNRPPGVACAAESTVIPGDLLRAIMNSIVFSISRSEGQGEFQFRTPQGMRRLD
jgi:uncharacterized protein YegL